MTEALARLEAQAGKRLGDPADPLLVSVRSGARESMPGMLDTVLNLGLNDESVVGLAQVTGNERFAWDAYRRFVQMFGNVVEGVAGEAFEAAIAEAKRAHGVRLDTDLDASALRELVRAFQALYAFPASPGEQLEVTVRAVFDSWNGARAVAYRRIEHIPDEWGTAVSVQQMVFGNKGDSSATGVAFSRDEITGAPEPSGDFLVDAQGEDVVSGVRNTRPIAELAGTMPEVHAELVEILRELEAHYGDMQDTEFTVEEGRLYLLQTRNAKRPAQAAVRFACDAVDGGQLTREQALMTIDPAALDALLHPTFDPRADYAVLARGVAASPGAAKGALVFVAEDAELVARLEEVHPMLGTRGCRLGILFPEIYEMQVAAIMRAARPFEDRPGPAPYLEVMIPLVDYEKELEILRALVVRVAAEEGMREGVDYSVGTMIELPRACFVADRIAAHADFFSFGTNDLTQTALGFSRDDVETGFVQTYVEQRILDRSPFETIDEPGVGWLVRLAAWVGRERRPELKLGVCGEHGGDPDSIAFFHAAGLDYVSCSPFRVPIARVAAAQAAITGEQEGSS